MSVTWDQWIQGRNSYSNAGTPPGTKAASSNAKPKTFDAWIKNYTPPARSFVATFTAPQKAEAPEQGKTDYAFDQVYHGYKTSSSNLEAYDDALSRTLKRLGATPENVWDVLAQKHGAKKNKAGQLEFATKAQYEAYRADAERLMDTASQRNAAAETVKQWDGLYVGYDLSQAREQLNYYADQRLAAKARAERLATGSPSGYAVTQRMLDDAWKQYDDFVTWETELSEQIKEAEWVQKYRAYLDLDNRDDFQPYASLGAAMPDAPDPEAGFSFGTNAALGDEPRAGAPGAYNEVHHLRNQGLEEYVAMKDEELARYDYLLAKDREHNVGKPESEWAHEAEEYFQFIRPLLRERVGTADAKDLKDASFLKKAGYVTGARLKGWVAKAGQTFVGHTVPDLAESYAEQKLVANAETPLERYALQAVGTVAEQLPSMLVGGLAGKTAGLLTMGVPISGGAYKAGIEEYGMSEAQARTYGVLVAAAEVGLQSVLGGLPGLGGVMDDALLGKVRQLDHGLMRFAATLAVRGVSEVIEEEAQLFLEPAIRNLVAGTRYEAPTEDEMLDTAIVTMMSTAVTSLPDATISLFDTKTQRTGKRAKKLGIVDVLTAEALKLDPATNSYKLATELQSGDLKANATNVGQLYNNFFAEADAQGVRRLTDAAKPVAEALKENQQAVDEAQTIPYNKEVKTETATVLNRGESAYTNAGLPAAEAKTAAGIVQDLIDGKTVNDNKLKQLRLGNPKFRAVFTELTGVQFPEVVSEVQMRALARSAKNVAQETPSAQNEVQTVTQEQAVEMAQAQEPETPAAVSVEGTPSNRDSDTVVTRRGPITRAQFRAAMRRQPQYAEATDAELDAIFDDYRRDVEADDDIRFDLEEESSTVEETNARRELQSNFDGTVSAAPGIKLSNQVKAGIASAILRGNFTLDEHGAVGRANVGARCYTFDVFGSGGVYVFDTATHKEINDATMNYRLGGNYGDNESGRTGHSGAGRDFEGTGSPVSNGSDLGGRDPSLHPGAGNLAEGEPGGQVQRDTGEGSGSVRPADQDGVTYSPDYEHWRNAVKETEAQETAEVDDDIRFDLEGEADTAYLRAVESGDMETARELVRQAAHEAGFTEEVYHGMHGRYNVYQSGHGQYGPGVYFTYDSGIARGYGGVVDHLFVKVGKIATFDDAYAALGKTEDQTLDEFAQTLGFPSFDDMVDDYENDPTNPEYNYRLIELLESKGFEGFEDDGNAGFVLWDTEGIANRIKSADPVTYDTDGNVIPLSERFNDADDDIRFSVEGLETMLNMPWTEQYANRDSLPENSAMYSKETPDALRAVGLGDLALAMTTAHAKSATSGAIAKVPHAHHVTDAVVEQLPELMNDPVMILDSNTVPGDIMVVLDALDTQGNPVVATVHPNGHAWVGGEYGRANFITSVYGRDNLAVRPGADSKNNLLYLLSQPNKRGVLYWNRALTEELFQKANLRVPYFLQNLPSDTVLKMRHGYNPNYVVERGVFDVSEEEENHAQDNRAPHRGSNQRPGRSSADGGRAGRNPDHSASGRDGGVRGQQTPEGVQGQDPGRTASPVPGTGRGLAQTAREGSVGRGTVGELLGGVERAPGQGLETVRAADDSRRQVNTKDVNAAPRFNSWDEAFIRLNDGVDGLFGPDPVERMMFPDFSLSYQNEKGKWVTLATYPKTAEGLAQLNEELPEFLATRRGSSAQQTTSNKTDDAGVEDLAKKLGTKDGYEYTDVQLVHPHNGKKFTVHALNLDKHASAKVRKRARFYEKLGFKTLLVPKGEIISNLGHMAGGVTVRNTRGQAFVLVQDSDAQQCVTTEHEGLHVRLFVDYGLFFDIRRALIDAGYEKVSDRLRKSAEKAWGGAYKTGKMGKKSAEYKYSYEQEVYAEALAGNPGKLGDDILAIQPIVQAVVEQWDAQFMEMRKQKPRGWTPEHSRPNVFELEAGYQGDEFDPGIDDDDSTRAYDGDEMYDELGPKQQAWAEKFNAMHGAGTAEAVAAAVSDAYFRAQEEAKEVPVTASSVGSIAQQDEELLGVVTYGPKPSVGAADYGFDPYSQMQFEHGTIEQTGKNNHRVVDVPKSTNGVDRVSKSASTVMSAKATPESRLGTVAGAVVDGKLSHDVKTDAKAVNRARTQIAKNGFENSLADWREGVYKGRANADMVAMGATLLNNAGNSEMSGTAYVDLLVDYADLLTRAGQSLQKAKLFKSLTPEGRLYSIVRITQRMNRNITPRDNVPVGKWMKTVGEELAARLAKKAKKATGVKTNRTDARTVCDIILSDLTRYANEHLAKEETAAGIERTEMDRILDLFHNYDHYTEAWEEAKQAVLEQYGKREDIVAFLDEWGESELDYARMLTNKLLGTKEVTISRELADEYLKAETDDARDAVLDKILQSVADQIPASLADKVAAWRYTAMLGNLRTIGRNTGGNVVMQGARASKTTMAALAEALIEKAGGKLERTTSLARDKETLEAARAEFEKVKDVIAKGGRYSNEASTLDADIRDRQRIFKNAALEGARKGVKWMMDNKYFGDYAFGYVTFKDALARYIAGNHTTWSQASEELKNKAIEKAVKEAAEATFRDNNVISDAVVKIRYRDPKNWVEKGLNTIGEGIMPFRRTPANVGVRIWEYSPFGFITSAVEAVRARLGKNNMTGADIINELAKNTTGTILMLIGMGLRNAGVLTGSAPDDEKEKELWEMQGHQEYALEVGGNSYTLSWASPASVALFLGAELGEAFREKGVSTRDVAGLFSQLFDPMLEMSMLQGIDDALSNAQSYGDDSALVRFTANALWAYVTSFVPTVLGQVERSGESTRMTTYADKNKDIPDGVQRALGKASAKVPGWDYAQIQYIDAWGRPQKNANNGVLNIIEQFLSPGYASVIEETDMEKELLRLYRETGATSVLISRVPNTITVDKKARPLTGAEYLTYAKTRGRTAFDMMTKLTKSSAYRKLSDAQKVKAVEDVYDLANQTAKATVTNGKTELDTWVKEARTSAAKNGVDPHLYIVAKVAVADTAGIRDKRKGTTISGSKSLAMMLELYRKLPNLTPAQRRGLAEDLGVGKEARSLSQGVIERRLAVLRAQNS